jgi:hypothetical protein
MGKERELSILVISCDTYCDTWEPFFYFFWKHWPDCGYKVFLGTNFKDFNDQRVSVIKVGEDYSWAESTKKMLMKINSKYVLVFLDDYFIYNVNKEKINDTFKWFKELNSKYLQLKPTPKPHLKVKKYPELGEIKKGTRFRISLGLNFWEVKTFLELLRDGESAWDMEEKGTVRADGYDGFYRTWIPVVRYHNAIICGKWSRKAIKYCKREGLNIDTSLRGIYSITETFWINVKSIIRRSIQRLPNSLEIKIFKLGRSTLTFFRKIFH